MRPQLLELSAFGPFKEKQVIDFQAFNRQDLFLITGPTGAGKTYLFDAIMFALYGDSSGEERGVDELVSHFVEQGTESYVSLDFLQQGDMYRVKRWPKQYGRLKNGKLRANPDSAKLEFYKNNQLLASDLREGNAYITQLLGLDAKQFRQIVLLPQGEFRRFLLSNSKEKEAIFQEIFHTENLHRLQDALKAQEKALKEEYQTVQLGRQSALDAIDSGEDVSLRQALANDNIAVIMTALAQLNHKDKDWLEENTAANDELSEQIRQTEKVLSLLDEKQILGKQEKSMIAEESLRSADELSIKQHETASKLQTLEQDYRGQARKLKVVETTIADLCKQKDKLVAQVAEAKKQLQETEKSYEAIPSWQKEIDATQEKLRVFTSLDKLLKKQTELVNAQEQLEKNLAENKKQSQDLQLSKSRLEEKVEQVLTAEAELADYQKQAETQQAALRRLEEQIQSLQQLDKLLSRKEETQADYLTKEKQSADKEQQASEAGRQFRLNQAGILAKNLTDGEACPVCGSQEHPHLATVSQQTVSEEKLDALEDESKIARNECTAAYKALISCQERCQTLCKQLEITEEAVEDLDLKQQAEKKYLLENAQDLQAKIIESEAFCQQKDEIQKELQQLADSLQALSDKQISLNTQLENQAKSLNEITETYASESELVADEDATALQTKQVDMKEKVKVAENAYLAAKDYCSQIESKSQAVKGQLKSEKQNLHIRQEELTQARDNFTNALQASELGDDYGDFVLEEADYKEKQAAVANYQERRAIYLNKRQENEQALAAIENIQTVDKYAEIIQNLKDKQRHLQLERDNISARQAVNRKAYRDLESFEKQHADLDQRYALVSELASKANGGKETAYVSFERYVLGVYFDEIIKAANLRFKEMSNQQYYLRRSDQRKGGGGKGLDLDVMDTYTGKLRSVSSLSGGESFKASLSLAMGISDVVQNMSGGITIDTLFIDEGFGTLDSEALDEAIEALIALNTSGRMIGIISHVEELQRRIPAHIEVKKTQEGSFAKTVI